MAWYQFSKTPVQKLEPGFDDTTLFNSGDSFYTYLQIRPDQARFKYRGKTNPEKDNPIGFARMMAKSGLKVLYTTEYRGRIVDSNAEEVE